MSIKFNEVSSSGISESDFNAIAGAEIGHTKSIQIYRQNPVFSLHDDLALDTSYVWNAAVTGDYLAFIYRGASNHLHGKYLPTEDVDPSILSSWTDVDFGAIDSGSPVAITSDGSVFYVYYLAGGFLTRSSWSPPSGGFTSSATISTYAFSGVEWIGAIDDALGATAYVVIPDSQDNRLIYRVDASGITAVGISWPDALTGFSAQSITVGKDDTTGAFSLTDVRHIIAIASSFPNLYTEKLVDNQPQEVIVKTGGLLSFVVRPEIGSRPIQVSYAQEVQGFDEVTSVQYRHTGHLSAMNTVAQPDNPNDTLWLTAIGQNGDLNGSDETFGFYALYYYSSRDGKFWSQDQIIPIEDIETDFDKYGAGFQLLSLGYYTYAVSNNKILRSLGCGQFGNVHPTLTMDVSNRVNKYSSTASDLRQSTIELDNEDGYFYGTFLMSPGVFRLITKIGARKNSIDYLFQISVEEVDSIEDPRDRPRVLRVTSRDLMASLSDKVASVDAIQYDNIVIGKDTFDALGSATDSGLSHSDVVSGTFGTTDKAVTGATFNTLYIKSKYVNSVSFSTYKTSVASGSAEAEFSLPTPTLYTDGATVDNAPTYGGVVFRGIDKDNYWFCRFNYWTQVIELGERVSGVDNIRTTFAPNGTFLANANNQVYIGIRVEFLYSRIRVWLCNDPATLLQYNFAFEYQMRSNILIDTRPALMQGYTGQLGCGYSDEDQGIPEPDPITIGFTGGGDTWGKQNSFVPDRLQLMTDGGQVARLSGVRSTPSSPNYVDLSPTDYGDLGGGVWMVADPYNYGALVAAWQYEIRRLPNFATAGTNPVWTSKYIPNIAGGRSIKSQIAGSINRNGYWAWIELNPSVGTFYCYTFDDFATVHETFIGGYGSDRYITFALWPFSTNSNGVVYLQARTISFTGDGYKSDDWGETFTPYTKANFGYDGGGINLPYSLRGGGEAKSTEFLWTWYGWTSHIAQEVTYYGADQWTGNASQFSDAGSWGSAGMNSFTLNGDHLNWSVRGSGYYTSSDAGHTWDTTHLSARQVTNGFPTNPDWLVVGQGSTIEYTTDRGRTPGNIYTVPSPFGNIIQVFGDLSELYETTVHPSL